MAAKDKETTLKEENNSEEKLKTLECPFTWEMDDIDKNIDVDYHPHDDEDLFPLLKLMRDIMNVYVQTKYGEETEKILETLKNCDEHVTALKENADPQISIEAADYVLQATRCFVFFELEMKDKLESVLKKIKSVKNTKRERSTLIACRSIAWSKYHRIGSREAESFIRDAIKENANCDLWYFILGKNLRRKRRDATINSSPSKEESESFLKAYQMFKNPVYGIFVAQMYRESRNHFKALQTYKDIFRIKPDSVTVILRMALGFIQLREFDLAKNCLDEAAKICPTNSMYLHYQGIYYFKQNQFTNALRSFEKAIKDCNNLPAEKQYLQCKVKLDKSFKVIEYLLKLLEKYNTWPEHQTQPIILDIAFSFWKKDHNIKQALKYFLHAVEIDPKAYCITNYYHNNILPIKDKNVFCMLKRDLLPLVYHKPSTFDEETIEIADNLKKYCNKYYNERSESVLKDLYKLQLKN